MPAIDVCFSGHFRGLEVEEVIEAETLERKSVLGWNAATVADKLKSGEWLLSLSDALESSCKDSEVEIFDFEPYD